MTLTEAQRRARVGQCFDCAHARRIQSAKGSEFLLCEKSGSDPTLSKYPALPVWNCRSRLVSTQKMIDE